MFEISFEESLCELGNTWKFSLSLALKTHDFESKVNWEKLGSNLCFTVENKASNLHKIKLLLFQTQLMRYSVTSKFKNLFMNWEKYVFY